MVSVLNKLLLLLILFDSIPCYSKVRKFLSPTSKVLVQGCGGLGLNAIQILKNYGCHIVVASDVKGAVEKLALEYGADEFHTDINKSDHEPLSFDVIFWILSVFNQHSIIPTNTLKLEVE